MQRHEESSETWLSRQVSLNAHIYHSVPYVESNREYNTSDKS